MDEADAYLKLVAELRPFLIDRPALAESDPNLLRPGTREID